MNCREFLERYSEYADGLLPSAEATRLRSHAESCAACARYDRVVRRGAELARDLLPRVHVSGEFEHRVRHRLFHVRDEVARRRAGTSSVYVAAATVVLLGAGAGAGLLLLTSGSAPELDSRIVSAASPSMTPLHEEGVAVAADSRIPLPPMDGLSPAVAAVAEADAHDPHVATAAGWPVYSRGAMAVAFPGAHTSLVVTPADFRQSGSRRSAGPQLIRH
ncbi:MAG TPA: zf-HC2 domain-containing protein [Longimicrobiales bacterium]|nr:zf-HC2 domain-containing protein [Longimicrobiales bacterium]